jgi:hypothetical protein
MHKRVRTMQEKPCHGVRAPCSPHVTACELIALARRQCEQELLASIPPGKPTSAAPSESTAKVCCSCFSSHPVRSSAAPKVPSREKELVQYLQAPPHGSAVTLPRGPAPAAACSVVRRASAGPSAGYPANASESLSARPLAWAGLRYPCPCAPARLGTAVAPSWAWVRSM